MQGDDSGTELVDEDQGMSPVPDSDQPRQTVGPGSGSAQKHRLTLIMVQSIEGWFDPNRNPHGAQLLEQSQGPNSRAIVCSPHRSLQEALQAITVISSITYPGLHRSIIE